ncbi:MAG TPA: hypothetical protein ENM97_03055 [Moorella mulderi]|nr:hypothetical protein [Moorella mulderi]
MKAEASKGHLFGLLVTVLLLALSPFFVTSCQTRTQNERDRVKERAGVRRPLLCEGERRSVLLYYLSQDGAYLVPVTLKLTPTREVAKSAVERLLAGISAEGLQRAFPEGVKLRDVFTLEDRETVYVDLTREVLHMGKDQAERAIKSLVLTLTELEGVKRVQVLVEGEKLDSIGGVPVGEPLSRPSSINDLLPPGQNRGVQVYFADPQALFLIPVTVPPVGGEGPKGAVLALLAGPPPGSGLSRTVWPGTRLLAFHLEGSTAVVDLSSEAFGYGGGHTAEICFINSLLFTLTDFPQVSRVQILIEGQRRKFTPGGMDIWEPLPRPEALNPIPQR